MSRRKLIGRMNGLATRQRVYRFDGGLEVDDVDHYEITRKRVFFDDVLAVTYHRSSTWGFVLALGIPGMFFLTIGVLIAMLSSEKETAIGFAIFGGLFLLPAILRLAFKVDVITVFGRRTRAGMAFAFRKARARQLFVEILTAVRQEQEQTRRRLQPEGPAEAPTPPAYPLPGDIP